MKLIILIIFLSSSIVPMPSRTVTYGGITGQQPIVQPGVVNWWQESAEPGQGDNVVLYGHSSDVFEDLHTIQPGAVVTVTWRGIDYGYIVKWVFIVDEDTPEQRAENGHWLRPVGQERLTMVTCAGDDRLIVIAEERSKE